jgi:thioredoxin 1
MQEIEDFDSQVLLSDKTVVVDFWADWCGPCKALSPILDELEKELSGVTFYKVNVDDNEQLALDYGIKSIPTIGIWSKKGVRGDTLIGLHPKGVIKRTIEGVMGS